MRELPHCGQMDQRGECYARLVAHLSERLGLNSISLPKILPSLETCPNFHFLNYFSVTFDERFGRKLGRKLGRIFGRAIELSPFADNHN